MTTESIEGCIFLSVCVCMFMCECEYHNVCVGRSKDTEDSLGCLQVSVCPLLPLYLRRDLLLLPDAHTGLLVLKLLLSLPLPTEPSPSPQWYFHPTLKPLECRAVYTPEGFKSVLLIIASYEVLAKSY